jgi:flagella basal body P-ring formation protein FlgA
VTVVRAVVLAGWLGCVVASAPRAASAQSAAASVAIPVAARDLPRGHVLADADLATRTVVGATAADARATAGWITRRRIAAGEPLRPPAVVPPPVVAPGDTVDAVRRDGTIALTVRGVAMGSAAVGDQVGIRVDPQRRLVGTVAGPRLVLLP